MCNAPFNSSHLKYRYHIAATACDHPGRPAIDHGFFHHGEVGETLAVINEVANQLGISAPHWCHFMEEVLRQELCRLDKREDILCGLHEQVAAQRFQEHAGPELHR